MSTADALQARILSTARNHVYTAKASLNPARKRAAFRALELAIERYDAHSADDHGCILPSLQAVVEIQRLCRRLRNS